MGIVLQKRLLETRFKYQSPLADTPLQTLGAQLPREAFETAHERQTLPFHEIVSTSPKPPWPSPGAANANIMHIDMYTQADLKKQGNLRSLDNLWLGAFCDASHKIAICFESTFLGKKLEEWYFGLDHYTDSGVVLWPAQLRRCSSGTFLQPSSRMVFGMPRIKGIVDVTSDNIKCACFGWKPWAWQVETFPPKDIKGLEPAVRAFINKDGVMTVKKCMATHCCWRFGRPLICKFAAYFKIKIPAGLSLFMT